MDSISSQVVTSVTGKIKGKEFQSFFNEKIQAYAQKYIEAKNKDSEKKWDKNSFIKLWNSLHDPIRDIKPKNSTKERRLMNQRKRVLIS